MTDEWLSASPFQEPVGRGVLAVVHHPEGGIPVYLTPQEAVDAAVMLLDAAAFVVGRDIEVRGRHIPEWLRRKQT